MIPKHYSLKQEHPQSYEIHDARDGKTFHVAKHALDLGMQGKLSKIQKFAEGGTAQGETLGTIIGYPGSPKPQPKPKRYAEGTPDEPVQFEPQTQQGPSNEQILAAIQKSPHGADQFGITSDSQFGAPDQLPIPQSPDSRAFVAPEEDDAPITTSAAAPSAQIPGDGAPSAIQSTNPLARFASSAEQGLSETEKGLKQARDTEVAAQRDIGKAWTDHQIQSSKLKTPEQFAADYKKSDDQFRDDLTKDKINPDRIFQNMSTGQRIASALGLVLGGLFSASGDNPAITTINRAIDQDIDSQKSDHSKKMNLWKMNREAMQNDVAANLQTRNQMLTMVEAKTKSLMASMGSAESMAKFAPLLAHIQEQKNENYLRMGLSQGKESDLDPAKLVPILVKNPEEQSKVLEEIGKAQNVAANKERIMKAFDESAKDNTVLRTGAGMVRTPGSVMELHQLMLPNFKQIDGTVRQAAMDESFHNLTPAPGDTQSKIDHKRRALEEWMTSESAAPRASAFGLNLDRFKSTNPGAPSVQPVERVTRDGRVALFNPQTKQFMGYRQ